jgi:GNAT superfamily N-acetyltransferase
MQADTGNPIDLTVKPVTSERWDDLEKLFGVHGAYSGCWCMWWRIKRADFDKNHGEGNKQALKKIVASGTVPGLLAYVEGEPIGWCSIAPREQFPVLDRSPLYKRVDDQAVWSIVCLFFAKPYRGKGLSARLIERAVEYGGQHGASIVESYPVETKSSSNTSLDGFTGFVQTYLRLGFQEVCRRSPKKPILRYTFRS